MRVGLLLPLHSMFCRFATARRFLAGLSSTSFPTRPPTKNIGTGRSRRENGAAFRLRSEKASGLRRTGFVVFFGLPAKKTAGKFLTDPDKTNRGRPSFAKATADRSSFVQRLPGFGGQAG